MKSMRYKESRTEVNLPTVHSARRKPLQVVDSTCSDRSGSYRTAERDVQ